ncbi:PepSY-associated TM helix domain-containing protein [Methylocystis bryophila]|uniref:Peptidase n=1 Tax=Methylocystis bryophila TaxID=655015 RepID=A0A1W6MU59_9HYPH|nr:PepSY-associated TM helix domain-containing protein [Methylocystis bryophila]ARN81138.1 hypothetical protein B1812_08645 [Methylocystis bryophila]BDV37068.1 hypothetical protein DSM21852_03210 [Methylocystis bryophila]
MSSSASLNLAPEQKRRERLKAQRRLWLDIHLYIGLVAGSMLVVIGLTGSLLVFWQEIDEWLEPAMFTSAPPPEGEAAFRPLSEIRATLQAALPAGAKAGGVAYPRNESGCYKIYYENPATGDTRRLCIDPYNAKLLGDKVYWSKKGVQHHSLMSFLYQLHWSLLLYDIAGDNGVVVAIAAILLVVSTLTGVYLWWPTPGKWVKALTLKRGAKGERLNYDLHKLGGVYTALVMLAVLISGVSMNLHEQFVSIVDRVAPLSAVQKDEVKSGAANGRPRISFDVAVDAAARNFPEGRLVNIGFPADESGVYSICRNQIEKLSRFIGTRCVLIDQYSAEVLGMRDPATGTAGDVFMQWQWPLHSGRAFGWTGRILVCLTGLACPLLFVTGVIRWLQKRRSKKIHAEREANRTPAPSRAARG